MNAVCEFFSPFLMLTEDQGERNSTAESTSVSLLLRSLEKKDNTFFNIEMLFYVEKIPHPRDVKKSNQNTTFEKCLEHTNSMYVSLPPLLRVSKRLRTSEREREREKLHLQKKKWIN
jgi:hypothetical protein